MPTLPLPDGQLFYREAGSGADTVLLVHGWACDGSDWSWLTSDLAADHRCVAVDNRGHGRSSPGPHGYTPRSFAADAAAVIEQLSLGRPLVVGHSMGTVVASALAVERPELVRALVLVDPVYGADDEALAPVLAAVRQAPHRVAAATFERFYGARTPPWLPAWHRHRLLATDEAVVRDALVGLYEGDEGLGRRTIGETYLCRRRPPTLAVYGGTGASTAQWDRRLPHGPADEITVWPGYGHFLHQEDPARFAATVRAWLRRLPPKP